MGDITLAQLDERLASYRAAAKDPRRPVPERQTARRIIDALLDRRLELTHPTRDPERDTEGVAR